MKQLYFVLFSVLVIAGMFTVFPVSDNANLTDQGVYVNDRLQVDSNWSEYGTLDNLETDSDIIYAAGNTAGTWTSNLQQGENFNVINISTVSDIRDGQINYTLRFWEDDPTLTPNETVTGSVDEIDYTDKVGNVSAYDYFDLTLTIEETSGSNNQRPYVDAVTVEYIQNLDRSGLGLTTSDFEVIVLFTFIGTGLAALIKSV